MLKLFINYWTVFFIFIPIGFLYGRDQTFTPDFTKFFLNFLGLSNSYNGAGWFLQIYIILVIISPILIKIIKHYNSIILFGFASIIYFLSYLIRASNITEFSNNLLINEFIQLIMLLGTSLFSLVIGSLFAKEKIYTKIHSKFNNIKFKNLFCIAGFLSLIIFHSIVESAIIAPINGIIFI
ncbi:acyltransferase family protein [Fictibacillus arsenicus]|uniref:acyltransferase family protein n=1 Tax=Fictibacillus arsenicus TaxID=255247 RepID=UPI0009866A7F